MYAFVSYLTHYMCMWAYSGAFTFVMHVSFDKCVQCLCMSPVIYHVPVVMAPARTRLNPDHGVQQHLPDAKPSSPALPCIMQRVTCHLDLVPSEMPTMHLVGDATPWLELVDSFCMANKREFLMKVWALYSITDRCICEAWKTLNACHIACSLSTNCRRPQVQRTGPLLICTEYTV